MILDEIDVKESSSPKEWDGKRILLNLPVWDPTYWMKDVGKLMRHLIQMRARPYIFCLETPLLEDLRKHPEFTIISYRPHQSRFLALLRCLIQFHFDLVLWTYSTYRENALFAVWKIMKGLPYVIKSDSVIVQPRRGLRGRLGFCLFRWVTKSATLVIAEAPKVRDWLTQVLGSRNVLYMPTGVAISEVTRYRKMWDLPPANGLRPFFLFCGRVFPLKGIDLLIKSFGRIASQIPEWDIRIVGPIHDYGNPCGVRQAVDEVFQSIVTESYMVDSIFFAKWRA